MSMFKHTWQALGTEFSITIWDELPEQVVTSLTAAAETTTHTFDALYSRFKADSLVSKLATQIGLVNVPTELTAMLGLYAELNASTAGKINPAIGFALSDTGYDFSYSLTPKAELRAVPAFSDVLTIVDDHHIDIHEPVLLDLGALGKGFLVDELFTTLRSEGLTHFLVDGSGDLRYYSLEREPIACGLEDPSDPTKVVGTLFITDGALCASATNRRRWGKYHHYLDPHKGTSPEEVVATWVTADTAALADGLSSALFFVAPESLFAFSFQYCVLSHEFRIKKSAGFTADFFYPSST